MKWINKDWEIIKYMPNYQNFKDLVIANRNVREFLNKNILSEEKRKILKEKRKEKKKLLKKQNR